MATVCRGGLGLRRAAVLAGLAIGLCGQCAAAPADFYEVIELPKPSEEAPFDLGAIPTADVAKCTFRIITPMNAEGVAVGNAYKCEPSGDAWKIFVEKTTPLATLKFQKDHLLFQWERGVGRSAAAGVRNCLLQVGYGDARKFFTLRKPVRAASQAVDLRQDTTTISPEHRGSARGAVSDAGSQRADRLRLAGDVRPGEQNGHRQRAGSDHHQAAGG